MLKTRLEAPLAFLSDMDGMLVDSEALHWESVHDTLDDLLGPNAPRLASRIGWSDTELWSELKETYALPLTIAELIARRSDLADIRLKADPPPQVEGAIETLRALKEIAPQVPIAVISASPRAHMTLSLNAYESLYELTVSGEDDCDKNKPHPDPYWLAAERLGVPIERCWIFEDSPTGLTSALASGATVFAIRAHSASHLLRARCIADLSCLSQILPIYHQSTAPTLGLT